ncbi:MAG: hypothetical protein QW320_06545 [Ignisphaera sp.]|uniref:hypothetical protein n=1 Tax=Thermofilum sp. TaxID=1961369 RepID=UPI0031627D1F
MSTPFVGRPDKAEKWLRQYELPHGESKAWWLTREGICDYCGRRDMVIPVNEVFFFCQRHALSITGIDRVSRMGGVVLVPNLTKSLKCHICGRIESVMYAVTFRFLCYRCAWYIIGKSQRRLSVDGYRIV